MTRSSVRVDEAKVYISLVLGVALFALGFIYLSIFYEMLSYYRVINKNSMMRYTVEEEVKSSIAFIAQHGR